jgi:hypothetical protein
MKTWSVIKEMPKERARGPDRYIGSFYHKACRWIKGDVMAAVHKLYVGDGRGFEKLNRALITLIPKKQDVVGVGDYRPISLIHSFAKLCSKLLAARLRPKMGDLVSMNQSAFIKGRNLHDNFLLVHQLARKKDQFARGSRSVAQVKTFRGLSTPSPGRSFSRF